MKSSIEYIFSSPSNYILFMVTGFIILIAVTAAVRALLECSVPTMFSRCYEAYLCIKEAMKKVVDEDK